MMAFSGQHSGRVDGDGGLGHVLVHAFVVEGMEIVDKISAMPTGDKGMHQNVPQTPNNINAATVLP